jgi:nucleoside-diphosphate-sugar epimerase
MNNRGLLGISVNKLRWVDETKAHRKINRVSSSAKLSYFRLMILVTGGTGFLGAHLLYRLVSEGAEVKALKRPGSYTQLTEKIFSWYSDQPAELLKKIKWVEGDLLDIFSLLDAFEGVDQLYHSAAMVSLDSGDDRELLNTNVQGTANVVNAALEKNVGKLCYVSSIGALGFETDHKMIDEETPWDPSKNKSLYSKSKHEAEREVWRGMAEGLNAIIVNPSVILGPGNWNHGSPKIFNTIYKGMKFYPQGTNGFVDVKDVVTAMIKLMNSNHSDARYIVSSENISYQQLFNWIAEGLHVAKPKYKAGKWLGEIGWRLSKLLSLVSTRQHSITKSAVRSSNRYYAYSNKKLLHTVDMQYALVKESVANNIKLFLSDQD